MIGGGGHFVNAKERLYDTYKVPILEWSNVGSRLAVRFYEDGYGIKKRPFSHHWRGVRRSVDNVPKLYEGGYLHYSIYNFIVYSNLDKYLSLLRA